MTRESLLAYARRIADQADRAPDVVPPGLAALARFVVEAGGKVYGLRRAQHEPDTGELRGPPGCPMSRYPEFRPVGAKCTCGADAHNATVDAIARRLEEEI